MVQPAEPDFAPSTVAGFTASCAYTDAQLGQEEVQDAITLSVRAGRTGSDSKDATSTPPAGWVGVSHQVVELSKFGIVSFTVDTVPAGWIFSTTETIAATYSAVIDAAAQKGWVQYAAYLQLEQGDVSTHFQSVQSSHHALHLHATAKGRGLFQGGASGQFPVKANLRYTGVDNLLEGHRACHEAQLKQGSRGPHRPRAQGAEGAAHPAAGPASGPHRVLPPPYRGSHGAVTALPTHSP